MAPLVSCIMPTANRRAYIPSAIQLFFEQGYPNKELIIVDDGEEKIGDLVPEDPDVLYIPVDKRSPIGTKRNIACEYAGGQLIAHWDDDDWYAPWRLAYQVEHLLRTGANVCGLAYAYFFDPHAQHAWQYSVPNPDIPWVYGATLCYTRAFWQAQPFAPLQTGEDTQFVWRSPLHKILPLPDTSFYLGRIHHNNTSQKRTQDPSWKSISLDTLYSYFGDDVIKAFEEA